MHHMCGQMVAESVFAQTRRIEKTRGVKIQSKKSLALIYGQISLRHNRHFPVVTKRINPAYATVKMD